MRYQFEAQGTIYDEVAGPRLAARELPFSPNCWRLIFLGGHIAPAALEELIARI